MTGQGLISKKLPKKPYKQSEKPERKEPPKREPLFVPPQDWQQEVKKSFTLATVIPPSQEKFLQENKPNFAGVKQQQEKLKEQREKLIAQIQEINLEIKKINNETQFKLDAIKGEIKQLREQLSPQVKQKKEIQEERQNHHAKIQAIKAQIDELSKTLYKKRKWTREQLEDELERHEEEIRNKKVTATEERLHNAVVEKIQHSLEVVDELEELQNEYIVLNNGLRGIQIKSLNQELKAKFDRLKELYELQAELKKSRNALANDEQKSRQISEEEAKLIKKKEQLQKKIDQIKADSQTVFENYQVQRKTYEEALHEENKRYFMMKLQKELKYEQKKKEIEEMKAAKEQELIERERS